MIAETAFNVIEVLSDLERKRLLKMLQIDSEPVKSINNNSLSISDAQCREILLNKFRKFSQRYKERNK